VAFQSSKCRNNCAGGEKSPFLAVTDSRRGGAEKRTVSGEGVGPGGPGEVAFLRSEKKREKQKTRNRGRRTK